MFKMIGWNEDISDGDTNFFDIVAGILQGNTLTSCRFIIFF